VTVLIAQHDSGRKAESSHNGWSVRRLPSLAGLGPRPDAKAVLKIPPPAPTANAYAERWVRTVRTECLDWLLIGNRHHLHRVLTTYLRHYNTARPHRGLNLALPQPAPAAAAGPTQHIERIDVLGGLIHEYQHAA
jgi:putative transposase